MVSEKNNAFSFLMAKKKPAEKTDEEVHDPINTDEKSVEAMTNDLNGKVNKIEKSQMSKTNVQVKNNVFHTLMKNSRKSFEPPPEEKKEELDTPSASADKVQVSTEVGDKVHADEKLKNMLRALQAVESENECVKITETERTKTKSDKKKSKKK